MARAIGAISIASGIAVTGVATTHADGPPLPLHNTSPGSTAQTGSGICAINGLDASTSYWHFVITKNPFALQNITLQVGAISYPNVSYVTNGKIDQAYVPVPSGASLTDLKVSGSFANVTPDPTGSPVKFVLSHTCSAPGVTPPPVDVCDNIEGDQASAPEGTVIDDEGNCVTPPVDVCTNLEDVQETVPDGMFINDEGDCVDDVCINLEGNQEDVPDGYTSDGEGSCNLIPPPVDVCNNIEGNQAEIPGSLITDGNGGCVTPPNPPVDLCTNIDGVQTTVPAGNSVDGTTCTPPPVDVCNNIDGNQGSIPGGLISNGDGGCVTAQVSSDAPAPSQIDLCSNIAGDQLEVPTGLTLTNGACEEVASEAVSPPAEVTLPVTGSNTASGIAIGLAMVAAGLVLSALARRRSARGNA